MWRWAVLVTVVAGCVSNGEHEAVINERDALSAQVSELKSKVASAESEKDRLQADLDAAKARIAELDNTERQKGIDAARQAIGLAPGQALKATIKTRLGDITCELWPDIAPITVQNFVQLAEGGREWTDPRTGKVRTDALYPGTVFHRVIPEFMVQGGDPLGTGTGGPGYEFGDEVRQDVKFDKPGLLAMANAGPGTNGSQFFVTDSTPRHLNMKHTIFGKCDLETVRKIMAEPLQGQGRERSTPVDPVRLDAIVITRG